LLKPRPQPVDERDLAWLDVRATVGRAEQRGEFRLGLLPRAAKGDPLLPALGLAGRRVFLAPQVEYEGPRALGSLLQTASHCVLSYCVFLFRCCADSCSFIVSSSFVERPSRPRVRGAVAH